MTLFLFSKSIIPSHWSIIPSPPFPTKQNSFHRRVSSSAGYRRIYEASYKFQGNEVHYNNYKFQGNEVHYNNIHGPKGHTPMGQKGLCLMAIKASYKWVKRPIILKQVQRPRYKINPSTHDGFSCQRTEWANTSLSLPHRYVHNTTNKRGP